MVSPRAADRSTLLQAFGIEQADLVANRGGTLGPRQRQRLLKSGNWNVAGAVLVGVILAAIPLASSKHPKPVQFITGAVLFFIVLIVAIRYFRRTRAAVRADRVQGLVGPVSVRSLGRSGFYLTVNGQSFRVPIRPWHITNGAPYAVYVAAGVIVGMEPE